MKLIDFDEKFSLYLLDWLKENEDNYSSADEMENDIPFVYEKFLNSPQDFLYGESPVEFFDKFQDTNSLLNLIKLYIETKTPLPDLLIERLSLVASDEELLRLVELSGEVSMLAISLLRERESTLGLEKYADFIIDKACDEEVRDNITQSLDEMGAICYPLLLERLSFADSDAKEAMLSILSKAPFNENVFKVLLELFVEKRDKTALLANYIARMGDERALPLLVARAKDDNTGYVDYIELRSAIEILGGEAPEREFDEAPYIED